MSRKLILETWNEFDIPWYMWDNPLYIIKSMYFEPEYDIALGDCTKYWVYLVA